MYSVYRLPRNKRKNDLLTVSEGFYMPTAGLWKPDSRKVKLVVFAR